MWLATRIAVFGALVIMGMIASITQAAPHIQADTPANDPVSEIMITYGITHSVPLEEILFDTFVASSVGA